MLLTRSHFVTVRPRAEHMNKLYDDTEQNHWLALVTTDRLLCQQMHTVRNDFNVDCKCCRYRGAPDPKPPGLGVTVHNRQIAVSGAQSADWFSLDCNCCRYRDAPEPQLAGHSVTVRPTAEDMKKLYDDAEQTWTPAFVKLIKVAI